MIILGKLGIRDNRERVILMWAGIGRIIGTSECAKKGGGTKKELKGARSCKACYSRSS